MQTGSPNIVATFRERGPYFHSRVQIEGDEATFPKGDKVRLTEAEGTSLYKILTNLKHSNPDPEYPPRGNSPEGSVYDLQVLEPPTLAMEIRAIQPNPNIPGEFEELVRLIGPIRGRIKRLTSQRG